MHDSVYIKFKNRENEPAVLEIRIMINLGARGAGSRHKGASGPDDAESPPECWSHK